MVLVNYLYKGKQEWGIADRKREVVYPSKIAFLISVPDTMEEYLQMDQRPGANKNLYAEMGIPFKKITFLAPLQNLSKNVVCIGKNYLDHILELSTFLEPADEVYEAPVFFTKGPNTLSAPYGKVPLHQNVTNEVDYEGELGIVIGKRGSNIPIEQADEYILGYTILNDVTARDLQKTHKQWFKGKSLDGFCPCGPWIVTSDEMKDPQNLSLKTWVNGEVRQDANTSLMMFKIREMVSILSQGFTLNPGDIIATGTPKGVGNAMKPPCFLKDGDVVKIEIEGIGYIENTFTKV